MSTTTFYIFRGGGNGSWGFNFLPPSNVSTLGTE
ncbi:hypothetical protein SLEP1_g53463 [Rubroshorea leprosula]|uniref:Uncharacterized protein n=1 Tax=Rubroshorea leprosula TaxID=152421 RepID=A0AAV5MDC9_9ROSI|nr:hypothetical protein SLEP1_g53463 [Rubroshorea leprosula]